MKRCRRALALVLAFVLAVSFAPLLEKVAKAGESADGYYLWYYDKVNNVRQGIWKTVGTPLISDVENPITYTGKSYLDVKKDYTVGTNMSITSYGETRTYGCMYNMSSNNRIEFEAPCDGVIEVYCRPRAKITEKSIDVLLNGDKLGDSMTMEDGQSSYAYLAATDVWKYEFNVVKDNSYSLSATSETGVAQILYIPVSSSGVEKDGYYKWTWSKSVGTATASKVGATVVTNIEGALTDSGSGTMWASDYADKDSSGKVALTNKYGDKTSYDAGCKLSSGGPITFTAPCDGVMEVYTRPRNILTDDVTFYVNDEAYGDVMTLPEGASTYADMTTYANYTISIEKGKEYKLGSSAEIAVFEVDFLPNAVSTLGASIRPEQKDHTNGIRFGSTIDKTIIDYSKVKESGTLIAAKANMDTAEITELTMDSVDKVCKKVERTTYLKENDSVIEYAAAVVNIRDEYKDMAIVARPYVVIDGVTYYGEQMTGSFNDVQAKLAAMNVQ